MANPYLSGLVAAGEERFNKDSADMTHGQWMCLNTTLNKLPFSFERYPFQEAIANDMHESLDCIKPSQVGLTEIQIRKALTILRRMDGISLIYTMPNEKMYKRISKARINPIIDNDRAFQKQVVTGTGQRDSMDLKRIGNSFLYVTGAAEADATSINADIVFNDEVDLTNPEMLALFNSRLQGSDLRINQRFSTPTYDGHGAHKGWLVSDQHEYMIKCRCCNHWQVPEFNQTFVHIPGLPDYVENLIDLDQKMLDEGVIRLDGCEVLCERCRKPLNLADYDKGHRQWVAKFPNRTHRRGYRVRPFSTHRLNPSYVIKQLFDYKSRDNLKGFYNTVLGDVYDNSKARLSETEIDAVLKSPSRRQRDPRAQTFMGVDMGNVCHIVIGEGVSFEEVKVLHLETCSVEDLIPRVKILWDEYGVTEGACDRHPFTPTANDLRDSMSRRLLPAEYRGTHRINEVMDEVGLISHLQCNRTMMLDVVCRAIRRGQLTFYGYGTDAGVLKTHLRAMVREEPEEGEASWIKLDGNDHYFHALAFMATAMTHYGIAEQLKDYQALGDAGFEVIPSAMLDTAEDLFGVVDLVGFGGHESGAGNRRVIRRY